MSEAMTPEEWAERLYDLQRQMNSLIASAPAGCRVSVREAEVCEDLRCYSIVVIEPVKEFPRY